MWNYSKGRMKMRNSFQHKFEWRIASLLLAAVAFGAPQMASADIVHRTTLDYGVGIKILTDEFLIDQAEIMHLHREAHQTFVAAEKRVKPALRGVEDGMLGPFRVKGRWQKKTTYDFPDDVKAKHRNTDPKGTFVVTQIEKMEDQNPKMPSPRPIPSDTVVGTALEDGQPGSLIDVEFDKGGGEP